MLRKLFSYGGVLLLAGAATFATPDFGWAAPSGGGHFGGGHFGGGHSGGGLGGGAHFGGYRGGSYHGGFNGPSYSHNGYHNYGSYGRGRYYPYYGTYYASPYYNYDGSYGPYSYPLPDVTDYSGYDGSSGDNGSSGDTTGSYPDGYLSAAPSAGGYQSFYPPTTAQTDGGAHVTVSVPAGARLWFGDTPTTSTGPVREFVSPPLTPGTRYTYDVKASWNENGHMVTQTQRVEVTAGAHVNMDFPVPPKTAGKASSDTHR